MHYSSGIHTFILDSQTPFKHLSQLFSHCKDPLSTNNHTDIILVLSSFIKPSFFANRYLIASAKGAFQVWFPCDLSWRSNFSPVTPHHLDLSFSYHSGRVHSDIISFCLKKPDLPFSALLNPAHLPWPRQTTHCDFGLPKAR